MMIKLMIAAGLIGLGTAAAAQPASPPQTIPRGDFLAQSRAQFAEADADHDGAITKDELRAIVGKGAGTEPPAAMIDAIFAALDTNHDGKATAAEVEAHDLALFDRWDTNRDGQLSRDEMMAGSQAAQRAAPKP